MSNDSDTLERKIADRIIWVNSIRAKQKATLDDLNRMSLDEMKGRVKLINTIIKQEVSMEEPILKEINRLAGVIVNRLKEKLCVEDEKSQLKTLQDTHLDSQKYQNSLKHKKALVKKDLDIFKFSLT